MNKVILCTQNQGKVKEFIDIFKQFNLDIELISLKDLNDDTEVEENGTTFKENSYIKASYFNKKYHMATIADDSGLCIDFLNGAPGIMSARYSGFGPKENIKKVLKELNGVTNRKAHFSTDLCYIDKDGNTYHFVGRLDGEIGYEAYGEHGFGYDPIFNVEYDEKLASMASLPEGYKDTVSHRYNAICKFVDWYKENKK